MIDLPPTPPEIKHIAHYLKVADEHDERNIVVSYWSRMYACQVAMKSIPGKKPPEVTNLLIAIMDWLEKAKKEHADTDGITNDTQAQALIEQYAIQLFQYADGQDQAENFGKNVVKAFYTAGILMDVLQQFGTLSEDIFSKRKYAKWKAAYIHNCLKNGERPQLGPPADLGDDEENDDTPLHPSLPPARNLPGDPPGPSQPYVPFSPPPVNPPPPSNTIDDMFPSVPGPTQTPTPQPAPRVNPVIAPTPSGSSAVGPEQIEKAQKLCKYAGSALTYDDVTTAIDNLQRALRLLQTGEE